MDSSAFKASLLKNSLPGTKPWLNGVRLVSTGLAQLDQFLGGGLPLGSLVLIEEDQNAVHAQTLMQYFVSQGIACGHRVCIAGGDGLQGFQEFVNTLPANVSTSGRSSSQTENSQQKMESTQDPSSELKIAWQYKKYMGSDADNPALHAMPQVGEGTQKQRKQEKMKYCCAFDLHRRLPREEWEASDSRTFNVSKVMLEGEYSSVRETQGTYSSACRFLADQVRLSTNEEANNPKAGRLCVLGAGGPQWGGLSGGTDSGGDKQFVRFLHSLKRIVSSKPPQSHHSLAIVTIPSNTLPTHVLSRARCIADGVIQITAFAERGPEAARSKSLGNSDSSLLLRTHKQTSAEEFADYTGMLTIKKIPCINSLVSARPDTLTYLFKRDRRKMKIERFHLPPGMLEKMIVGLLQTTH